MRFKNLTIHVTLGFLSVIALVALALLPITNGICEWTGDESSKSYYTNSVHIDKQANPDNPPAWSEDTRKGRGWHLSANLSASVWGSSAYMSCSIYGEKPLVAYTERQHTVELLMYELGESPRELAYGAILVRAIMIIRLKQLKIRIRMSGRYRQLLPRLSP